MQRQLWIVTFACGPDRRPLNTSRSPAGVSITSSPHSSLPTIRRKNNSAIELELKESKKELAGQRKELNKLLKDLGIENE